MFIDRHTRRFRASNRLTLTKQIHIKFVYLQIGGFWQEIEKSPLEIVALAACILFLCWIILLEESLLEFSIFSLFPKQKKQRESQLIPVFWTNGKTLPNCMASNTVTCLAPFLSLRLSGGSTKSAKVPACVCVIRSFKKVFVLLLPWMKTFTLHNFAMNSLVIIIKN